MQLEIEEAALKKETDRLSVERLENLHELTNYVRNLSRKRLRGSGESRACFQVKEEIESLNNEIQIAQRNYDLNKAAELQYGKLPELVKDKARGSGRKCKARENLLWFMNL